MSTNPPSGPWERRPQPGYPMQPPPPGYGPTGPPRPPFPPHWSGSPASAPGMEPLAPNYPPQPAGYWPPAPPRKRSRLKMWASIGVAVVVVAATLVLIGSQAGWFGQVLDNQAVAKGVRKILVDNYEVEVAKIQSVTCPADQPIKPGHTFTCVAVIGSEKKHVPVNITIKVLDTAGEYEVGPP